MLQAALAAAVFWALVSHIAPPPLAPARALCRGFTPFSRDDYVLWKKEGRLQKDGVVVRVSGRTACGAALTACALQPASRMHAGRVLPPSPPPLGRHRTAWLPLSPAPLSMRLCFVLQLVGCRGTLTDRPVDEMFPTPARTHKIPIHPDE